MTEAWGWDTVTGDWLDDVDTPVPTPGDPSPWADETSAPVAIPTPRDGRLTEPDLAPVDVTGADER
jgi:hypothetical protein